jgi:hypothetical protein
MAVSVLDAVTLSAFVPKRTEPAIDSWEPNVQPCPYVSLTPTLLLASVPRAASK